MAAAAAAAATVQDYEWALARIPQLEVDLASAQSGLERALDDNQNLRDIHTDLVSSYKRLQEQNESLRTQLRRDQEDRHRLADEHQQQVAAWRSQLEAKARDFEAVQSKLAAPRELDNIKLQLIEEIEGPFRERVRELEGKLGLEQRKAADAHRQSEMMKIQSAHKEEEHKEEVAEMTRRHRQREQTLERQIAAIEVEARKHVETAAVAANLRIQLQEQHTKALRLQQETEAFEQQTEREKAAAAEELRGKIEDAASARRHAHDLEAQLNQEERRRQTLTSELDTLRREKDRLEMQLDQAEARAQSMAQTSDGDPVRLQADLAQVRMTLAAEREQNARALKAAEDQHHTASATARRAEARLRQLEDEQAERERESQREQSEAERRSQEELAAQRAQVQILEKDLETKRQAWRERETALLRQVEDSSNRADEAEEKLEEHIATHVAKSKMEQDDLQKQLREARKKELQVEQIAAAEKSHTAIELNSLRTRAEQAERERGEIASAAEVVRAGLRKEEKRANALQVELSAVSQRLDDERNRWAKEVDDAHAATLKSEEQRRAQAAQRMQEEHRRQFAKHQAAAKKALQKCARKRQELRTKCQDLARKVAQLQQEKATAIRICEDNKSAYELRLAELGLAVGAASRSYPPGVGVGVEGPPLSVGVMAPGRVESPGAACSRRELRGISDRLERQVEWLRSRDVRGVEPLSAGSVIGEAGGSSGHGGVAQNGSSNAARGGDSPLHAKAAALSIRDEVARISTASNPQGR